MGFSDLPMNCYNYISSSLRKFKMKTKANTLFMAPFFKVYFNIFVV